MHRRARASDPLTDALDEIRVRVGGDHRGADADYIPGLSTADPRLFGLALASLTGNLYVSGDALAPFTIQSISKPFVYALALADLGLEQVLSRVGAEPSGEAFNAISLEAETGRPANPMVNAGAIVTVSLLRARDPAARFARIQEMLSAFAGRHLEVDEAVFGSELETGDRNRALAYLMRNAGSLRGSVDDAITVYFRQCSVLVTAADVAVMAATLANAGMNPRTKMQVVEPRVAEHVLAVMATCGMYDYAGEWLLRVGLPAKSGVSGGLVAVSPGQFGIGLYSPRLDERGNSVRAIAASQELAERFALHLMHEPGRSAPAVYLAEAPPSSPSSRPRRRADREVLQRFGSAIGVLGVQGDVELAAAETILQALGAVMMRGSGLSWLVIDLHRVSRLHLVAAQMLDASIAMLAERNVEVAVADPRRRGLLRGADAELSSLDEAIAWCEERLLGRHVRASRMRRHASSATRVSSPR